MAVTSRHNKYTSIPDWFSGQSTETATTSSSVSQTVYISGSSGSTTTDSTVDFKDIPIDASTIVWQNELLTVPIDNDKIIIVDGKLTTSINSDGVWELRLLADGTNYIYTTYPVVTQLGITMYSGTEGLDIGGIYDGLPIDNNTIYWDIDSDGNRVLKATGSSGGGVADSVAWSNIEGKPSWLLDNKISYSEIEGTPDLSKYALVSQIPSLEGYALSSDLAKYIPISGYTDITGEKNFTGGLKVNDSPIYYDKDKKYWKLEGDLLVTGGVTMYGNDSEFVPSTIMDAIAVDGITISKEGGILKFIGSIGGATTLGSLTNVGSWADSVASRDRIMYQAANSSQWVAKNLSDLAVGGVTGDYLPLSGGILTNTLTIENSNVGLILHRSGQATPYIRFGQDVNNEWGELGVYHDGRLVFWPRVSSQGGYGQWNTVWHSGNDGSGSSLDADLLDGKHYSDIINSNVASATKLQTARTIWGQSFDGMGNVSGTLSGVNDIDFASKGNYVVGTFDKNANTVYTNNIHSGKNNNLWLKSTANTYITNSDGTTKFLTILTNGNVGIGEPNPSQKLHVAGNILTTGGVTMYSARKLKTIQDERGLSLKELSIIKPTRFTWKDGRDNKVHIGGIADDVMKVLPEVIYKTGEDDTLTMDYGNAAFAIAASLIKPVVNHEERIKVLEEENKRLKEEVEQLKQNIV